MCLGIPAQIIEISDPKSKLAHVDVNGTVQEVNISGVMNDPEKIEECIGKWVLVHMGFATSKINEEEAQLTIKILRELGKAQEELEATRTSGTA